MHRLIGLALLLGACAAPAPPAAFRAAGAPIWSNAFATLDQIEGDWMQVADFSTEGAGCATGRFRLARVTEGWRLDADLCLAGKAQTFEGIAVPIGPGRFALRGATNPLDAPLWLLWVDTDSRTLAIGTPSGQFGFVLDRGPQLPADRRTAAREVMAFNGYDLAFWRDF